MRTKLILILAFFPLILLGQKQPAFKKLIKEINYYLNEYEKLSPLGDEYYPILGFGLSSQEITELINEADYDATLTKNKDSIQSYHMIEFFQTKIEDRIDKIVKHPDFIKNNISSLKKGGVLSIVKSDDNKLFNFSFDSKTGGTYRSRISMMYYTELINTDTSNLTPDYSIFADDGYDAIHTIQTDEGTKYVLTGNVRGCSYCFNTFVQLIKFSENEFVEEFVYSVNNRDWNDGVRYDHETKTIYVNYHIDDLTPYCNCSGEINEDKFDYDKYAENETSINCKCKFIFNGISFELVEESWKRVKYEDRKE
ncbi:MAG: hypothetical protein DRJ01_13305 [Bacteroidetes bacterium]|nr:MAG: hypothetical protein DRJ01_13305 [Bacteroidota bacterium]